MDRQGKCRVLIGGVPGAGKTTLAERWFSNREIIHTDSFMHIPWKNQPFEICRAIQELEDPLSYVIEGVSVTRLYRYGLKPDVLYFLPDPFTPLTKNQQRFANSITKWVDDFREGGIPVITLHKEDLLETSRS